MNDSYNQSLKWLKTHLPSKNKDKIIQDYQNTFEPKIILLGVKRSEYVNVSTKFYLLNKESMLNDKYTVNAVDVTGATFELSLYEYIFNEKDFEELDEYLNDNDLSALIETYHTAAIRIEDLFEIIKSDTFKCYENEIKTGEEKPLF